MIDPRDYDIVLFRAGGARGVLERLFLMLIQFGEPIVKYRAHLAVGSDYGRFKGMLDYLLEKGLVEEVGVRTSYKGRSRKKRKYVLTDEGKGVIALYNRLFDSLGMSSQVPVIATSSVKYDAFTGQKTRVGVLEVVD